MPKYIIKDIENDGEVFEVWMNISEKDKNTVKDTEGNSCFFVEDDEKFGKDLGRYRYTIGNITIGGFTKIPLATRKFGEKHTTRNFNVTKWV